MAKISKPTTNRKGAPPPEFEARINLSRNSDQDLRPLNFKVPAAFKREFKAYANEMDMSMVSLLVTCFEHYKSTR
ncbi:MAG: hypothetical protein K9J37_01890 [Saprospiraceae bacterium]|nr:hypothetical protein [Saprospiraceae bacterium]MCF8248629.1 hypothetical protein [Saprospiraceae bacterium]MCF8278881.1 hypothetical protein [Bacteroidales bacterium]MCF8310681.1 hypothetical protein [Saprospiraceae bacterium]MCF8439240.1 hypothetical protein [Saprospiraceae bacterium]